MTLPVTVSHAVQQTQEWLKELRDNGNLADENEAYSVLRAVLHQLRDRLTVEEAVDLGAQLPLIVRGILLRGLAAAPRAREGAHEAEIPRWCDHEAPAAPQPAEPAVRDVFTLLAHHCDPGEIADVIAQFPGELKELWPEGARSFKQSGG